MKPEITPTKTAFPTQPECETCRKETAAVFIKGLDPENPINWRFVCPKCDSLVHVAYRVEIDSFLASPAHTVNWLAHLGTKGWMNWAEFAQMMRRFRSATGSHGIS
jgi:hypothetical protein